MTVAATNAQTPSPNSGGTITSDGGYSITSKGVCWSTNPNPTINNNSTSDGTGASNFTSILSNLLPTTTYYYRAYATNSIGTSYGITYTFTTASNPRINTSVISAVASSAASSGGTIVSDGGATITAKGVCWSTSPSPTIALSTKTNNGTGTTAYTSSITGLLPITAYYLRAYATNSFGTAYGQEEVFTTLATLPTLTTTVASAITSSTASSGGTISSDGGAPITNRGIVWSTITNPTIAANQGLTSDGTGIGTFASDINQLTSGTLYYVRACATNSAGTAYGNQITFSSSPGIPLIAVTAISSITSTTAISGVTISSNGGATITAKGVCWSTSPNPTIALTTKTSNGSGTANFTSNITELSPLTTYYVKSYATNSFGTAYGLEIVITTLSAIPNLTTTVASSITSSTASSGGTISSDGGVSITDRGIVWSTTTNPTITTNQGLTSDGTGIGLFTSAIIQLTPGTIYYVRAYATNSVGTAYGNQITFSALQAIPSITTTSASAITNRTASSGGTILNDGGATITAKGVCWSTITAPTIALTTKTNNGTGNATFTSNITGLNPGTIYYVRAYATNSVGTAYGQEVVITTLTALPTLTTTLASSITTSTASSGGTISNDGGTTITAKGVCWSTSPNPTIALNTTTNDGTGTTTFASSITALTLGTMYYVRAYATNSVGTAYGNQITFMYLTNVTIGTQIWQNTNLDVTTYKNGDPIPQVSDPTAWAGLTTGAWCYYNNDSAYGTTYGKLYNWYAVKDPRGLAPSGWHIPTDSEWYALTFYLGGENTAGGKLKSTSGWQSAASGGTGNGLDNYGFKALPGGYRQGINLFSSVRELGYWWSSTELPGFPDKALIRVMSSNFNACSDGGYGGQKSSGFSVRCVKD